ncbi:hypothetical protein GCM10027456_23110 [Kineosporia babensis]
MIAVAVAMVLLGTYLIGAGTRAVSGADAAPEPSPPDRPAPSPAGHRKPERAAQPPQRQDTVAGPLKVLQARAFTPATTSDHESTAEERQAGREHIGTELETDLTEALRLLEARPPELRGMQMNAPTATVAQELAVLRAHLRGALTDLDARLRTDPVAAGDLAVAACVASILKRMPAHCGVTFHRAHRRSVPLDAYFPGSLLHEPGFARADRKSFPAGGIGDSSLIDQVIWSESGRLTPLLIGYSDTVLFPAASRFRVLGLDRRGEDVTVFLAEELPDQPLGSKRLTQILDHLRGKAADAGVGPIDGPRPSPVAHIGLDQNGQPFAPRTAS